MSPAARHPNAQLQVATSIGGIGPWVSETVDTAGAWQTQMLYLANPTRLVIGYRDPTTGALKLAVEQPGPAITCSGGPPTCSIPAGVSEAAIDSTVAGAAPGSTFQFGAGTFNFTNTITVNNAANLTFKGAGIGQTILEFAGQTAGSGGISATLGNSNIRFEGFTIQNTLGDGIKVEKATGVGVFPGAGALAECGGRRCRITSAMAATASTRCSRRTSSSTTATSAARATRAPTSASPSTSSSATTRSTTTWQASRLSHR